MKKYELGDIATFYFVTVDSPSGKRIQGWTDDKNLAKFYIDFHQCSKFKLKTITDYIENITNILNENTNDEIDIANLSIHTDDKHELFKTINAPLTSMELHCINDDTHSFMMSMINYSYMESAIPYLKRKYRDALEGIFVIDIIKQLIHNIPNVTIQSIAFDELLMLFTIFPENFGK